MKINRFGRAEILTPDQINLLFTEGFVNPRDRALFGVCLYRLCIAMKRDIQGKFALKSDDYRAVRSVRLTDFTWQALGISLNLLS